VARTRTTKKLAQRIDLNYFKRPTPLKRAKFWLSFLLPLLALVWIAWHGLSGDHRVYSSGRMSRAHAVLDDLSDICDEARQLRRQERLHHWLHDWLLLHIPLSLALILLGAVHAVMALRY